MSTIVGRRLRRSAAVLVAAGALVIGGLATAYADDPAPVAPMIVGGRDATQVYPFMTAVLHPNPATGQLVRSCGASLVVNDDKRGAWVLTAGHCAEHFQPGVTRVRVGSNNWTEGGHEAGISEIIVHPGWKSQPGNDFGLLRLDRRVPEKPIRFSSDPGQVGDLGRIIGWGEMCDATDPRWPCYPSGLQEADVRIAPDEDCYWYDKSVELCGRGADGNAMACFGDSGGPLLKQVGKGRHAWWELIGITSRDGDADRNPACSGGTGVFGDATKFRGWVDRVSSGRPLSSDVVSAQSTPRARS